MERDIYGCCVGEILGPVQGIGYDPLLRNYVEVFIWNVNAFLKNLYICHNKYSWIKEWVYKLGT